MTKDVENNSYKELANIDKHLLTNTYFYLKTSLRENGSTTANNNRMTSNFIELDILQYSYTSGYTQIEVESGYRVFICMYDENKTLIDSSPGVWITENYTLHTGSLSKYIRFTIATVGDVSPVGYSDEDKVRIYVPTKLENKVTVLYDYSTTFKGFIEDLDVVFDPGQYCTHSSTQHIPEGLDYRGSVINIPLALISTEPLILRVQQFYIDVFGVVRYRYSSYRNNELVWNDWTGSGSNEEINWLAVGDSITKGVYSYYNSDGTASSGTTSACWVKLLANSLGYRLTTMASRGMGYTVTGQDPLDSSLPRIALDQLLTRIEALDDSFNLITLAFGINDYNTTGSTIQAIQSSLDNAIRRLLTKWPESRLVVITPFNCRRHGDVTTTYAYNYSYDGRSLKDIADAIKSRCDYYGVECFYASNGVLMNSYNMDTLLPDMVHPSLNCHRLIAQTLSHVLY